MDKNTIINRIFESNRGDSELTAEEYTEALKYFTANEIQMMNWPIFNHKSCFNKQEEKIISIQEALG